MYYGRLGSNQHQTHYKYLFTNKPKVYLTVLILVAFQLVVAVVGHNFKLQENKIVAIENKSVAYAQEIKSLKTYKAPTIDLKGKDRAIYIIKKIWRSDWKIGVALAGCESGFRETVIGVTHDVGYFQINPIHGFKDSEMQDGIANAGFAYGLYKEQGLTPWSSSKSCWSERI